jgi:murein L,D-transpeptidase YcbB/YkuD
LLLGDDDGPWTPERIQAALASKKTVEASFVKPLPVYIVYFSDAALIDGTIIDYKDLYNRDAKAIQALNMRDGGASLAPPKPKPQDVAGAAKPGPKPAEKIATR